MHCCCFDYDCCCCHHGQLLRLVKKVLYGTQQSPVPTPPGSDTPDNPDQPEPTKSGIYVGTISALDDQILSFTDITETHLKQFTTLSNGVYDHYEIRANQYDLIVVAVPTNRKVYMDNGFGDKVEFYVNASDKYGQPFYCNGDITKTVDGIEYRLYGLFTAASGLLYIYIE